MSDFDVFCACHIVDSANQRVRFDVVALAQSEKEAHFVAVVMLFLFLFLFFTIVFGVVDVKVAGIFVIVEETVEVQGDDACDEFFAREPAEFAEHYRQVVVDVVAHDVDFLDVVDMAEELFLAHLASCRDECSFKRLPELFLDGFYLMFLLHVHEADADAGLVGASCSAAAVHVGVDVVREVIVDDM